ncbi:Vigilin [Portunus trituberculatus]|uniref:Vigilin n=1 Tax=Portunus trituberculatus TaxID=210409 RepID=A0A5B7EYS0_PORTR|nr:Vigilin [Portunus trituberculatus]
MDFNGGEISRGSENWEAIEPAPLDSADMEDGEKHAGCGCLHILQRLFRRKKCKKVKNIESKVNLMLESEEVKKDEVEESAEDDELVTRAIVHVDAQQDENEEPIAEVEESEEEIEVDSSECVELEDGGEVKAPTAVVHEGSVTREGEKDQQEKEEEVKAAAVVAGVTHLPCEVLEDTTEGWTVVSSRKKRRHKKVKALPALPERKPAVNEQAPRPPQARAAPHRKRQEGSAKQRALNSVRCSWQEEAAEVAVPVAPPMRRCIVGPRGATLQEVHQQFAGVRVTVPPPKDTVTTTVKVRGPPRQVAAAVAHLKGLLHEAEVIEARVAVAPHQRRHVVGHRGVTVRELQQQFPDVSVTVPPAGDLKSRSVLLRGPRSQVPGAEAFLQARLQAARTDTRRGRTSRRHAYAHTPSRQ